MWFRVVLVVAGMLSGLGTLYLGLHESSNPTVFGRWSGDYFAIVLAAVATTASLAACHWSPIYTRLYKFRIPLVTIPTATLLSILVLELGVRVLDPMGVSYYEAVREYELDKLDDPELSYRHPPNHENEYGGVHYSFNEMGLRDDPIEPKSSDEYRIVFLGDSATLGMGAEREDTFAYRLGAVVEKRRKGPVRSINTGVGSYNSTQELRFFRRHGKTLEPDLVILIYVTNDINPMVRLDPQRTSGITGRSPGKAFGYILGRFWTYRLVNHITRGKAADRWLPKRESPGWQESMNSVSAIAAECKTLGVPLAIALCRRNRSERAESMREDLSAIAKSSSSQFIDLLHAFEGADLNTVRLSVVDGHFNREGNGLIVRYLDSELARLGFPDR